MAGPHPAVAAIRLAVRQSLSDLPKGSLVMVACSGGPDSLALAAGTAFTAPRLGLMAGALCVDHALQAGSDEVAEAAAQACRAMGLAPVSVLTASVAGGGNLEAAAREARYAALMAAAETERAAAVMLGHTLDDQAETVLLAMGRGAGLTALAGMTSRRGLLRRPLLGITRAQTLQACQAQELEPWHDPMNLIDGPVFSARARLRQRVLPELEQSLGGGVAAALARTAQQVAADLAFLDDAASQLFLQVTKDGQVDAKALAAAAPALRHRALKLAALHLGADGSALTAAHVKALDDLVVNWHGQGPTDLPGGLRVGRECGKLEALPLKR